MPAMALEKVLRGIALAGAFALPFVCLMVTSSLFFPYITGKNFAFRIIVEIMTAAWLALALIYPAYRPRRSWVLGALALFVLIIGIADVLGMYAFKSLWSNFERMDGWVTIAHLLLYTVVTASVVQTEKMWRWLWWTTLGVSLYVSLYGLLQVSGKIALGLGGAGGLTGRIDATFGNPIYLAVYMLFHVFIAAMLWAQQWVEKGPGKRLTISLVYGGIMLFDTFALFFTGTRGTMLGIIGGAFVAGFLMLILGRNSRNVWRASVGFLATMLVLAGIFFTVKDQAWVQRFGPLQRLASISLTDQTVQARFINWSMAWEGIKERPILGWGQENYALVFDKYYDPRMYRQEPWFDRVHNIVFDWLVAGGALGFLAYVSIFAAALWALWRSGGFSVAERALLTGLLAGYSVHNFFVFDNVTSYILFGTVLAFIAYRASAAQSARRILGDVQRPARYLPYAAAACTIALLFASWGVNQRALAANRALLKAISGQGDPAQIYENFRLSIEYGTIGTQEAREQLAQLSAGIAGAAVSDETKLQFFTLAETEMKKQADESPLDARFPLFLGLMYESYGRHDEAKAAYEKALTLSPKKQTIMFQLAQNAQKRGDSAAMLAYFKQAYELEPGSSESALYYAATLIQSGNSREAEAILAPFVESGTAADTRILSAYRSQGLVSRAVPLWEAKVAANPQDAQSYFTLAAIHYMNNDKARAIAALEEAKRVVPAVTADADSVIQQIRSGTAVVE